MCLGGNLCFADMVPTSDQFPSDSRKKNAEDQNQTTVREK